MKSQLKINSKVITGFTKVAMKHATDLFNIVKKNKPAVIMGTLCGGLAIDDFRVRIKCKKENKQNAERNLHTQKVLLKHEAKIKTLKSEVERVPELVETNEQLRHVIIEQQRGASNEQI